MKILLAPDKFKGSLSAKEVCSEIMAAFKQAGRNDELVAFPLADGGEGSIEAIAGYTEVHDALGKPISAYYLYEQHSAIAFIELAVASGLSLIAENERDILNSSSLGTGEQILHAINAGAKEIILGIGGSASNDAGIGILHALGFRFKNESGQVLEPLGRNLEQVTEILWPDHELLKGVTFKVLCDVSNPLFGKQGAAHVYAAQKGADENTIEQLDKGLQHFAEISFKYLNKNFSHAPGAGAAGGVGFGMLAFLNARLSPGIDTMMQLLNFDEVIKDVDLVISGEGKFDEQTLSGKVLAGVYQKTLQFNKPLIIVAGLNALPAEKIWPDVKVFTLMDIATNTHEAIQNAAALLRKLIIEKLIPQIPEN